MSAQEKKEREMAEKDSTLLGLDFSKDLLSPSV